MRINGYWLGAGLIMLLDYIWFLFVSSNESFFGINCTLTMIGMIICLGLAFKKEKQ